MRELSTSLAYWRTNVIAVQRLRVEIRVRVKRKEKKTRK